MSDFKEGYYWVRISEQSDPRIGEFTRSHMGEQWTFTGTDRIFDRVFLVIDGPITMNPKTEKNETD